MSDRPLQRKRCRNCRRLEGPFINRPSAPFDRHSEVDRFWAMNPTLHVNPLTGLCGRCASLLESIGGGVKSVPFSEHLACIEYGCERCRGRLPWEQHLRECEPTEYVVSNGAAGFSGISRQSGIAEPLSPSVTRVPLVSPTPRIPISARVKRLVRMRDRNMCRNCAVHASAPGVVMHIDHVIPLAEAGTNALSNLQLLCAKCNLAKGKKTGHYDESEVLDFGGTV